MKNFNNIFVIEKIQLGELFLIKGGVSHKKLINSNSVCLSFVCNTITCNSTAAKPPCTTGHCKSRSIIK